RGAGFALSVVFETPDVPPLVLLPLPPPTAFVLPPSSLTTPPGRLHTAFVAWSGSGTSGWPVSASRMNCRQIGPAVGPPNPADSGFVVRSPTQPAVASCGVAPMNHASLRLSVVPFLPNGSCPGTSV